METIAEKANLTISDVGELREFCNNNAIAINDCWESEAIEYVFEDNSALKLSDCGEVFTYKKENFF